MAWFFRRAIPLGRFLRLNVSKRGLGASLGVPGLRVGVDASGKPYVSGGRMGVYFRKRLGGGTRNRSVTGFPGDSPENPVTEPDRVFPWLELVAWLTVLFGVAVVVAGILRMRG